MFIILLQFGGNYKSVNDARKKSRRLSKKAIEEKNRAAKKAKKKKQINNKNIQPNFSNFENNQSVDGEKPSESEKQEVYLAAESNTGVVDNVKTKPDIKLLLKYKEILDSGYSSAKNPCETSPDSTLKIEKSLENSSPIENPEETSYLNYLEIKEKRKDVNEFTNIEMMIGNNKVG